MANWDHKSNIGTHPGIDRPDVHNGLAQVGGDVRVTMPDVEDTHIPAGSLITVTIGRNIATDAPVPMTDRVWALFECMVGDVTLGPVGQVFGPFRGVGEWDGVTEESTTFTAITAIPLDTRKLDAELSTLARNYGQDAIAWSHGPARLARS